MMDLFNAALVIGVGFGLGLFTAAATLVATFSLLVRLVS